MYKILQFKQQRYVLPQGAVITYYSISKSMMHRKRIAIYGHTLLKNQNKFGVKINSIRQNGCLNNFYTLVWVKKKTYFSSHSIPNKNPARGAIDPYRSWSVSQSVSFPRIIKQDEFFVIKHNKFSKCMDQSIMAIQLHHWIICDINTFIHACHKSHSSIQYLSFVNKYKSDIKELNG